MKNLKSIITAYFIFLTILTLTAQENHLQREIGIRFGTSFTAYNEARYSAMTKKYFQPKVGLVYSKWNEKKREELIE